MDQHANGPSPELPRPERIMPQNESGDFVVPFPEEVGQAAVGERISQASSAVAQAATASEPVVIPLIDPAAVSAPQDPSVQTNPTAADDADVIEKEWVEKAKDIVAQTKTDPHQQSAALTTFRHDYMKKRYGKEIKLPEERAA